MRISIKVHDSVGVYPACGWWFLKYIKMQNLVITLITRPFYFARRQIHITALTLVTQSVC